MAGQLVQVSTNTITSAVASVTLTGINTDDVYMVALNNVIGSVDNQAVRFRVSNNTSIKTTDYGVAYTRLRTDTTFSNISATGEPSITLAGGAGINTGEHANAIMYLYNFYDSSKESMGTFEPVTFMSSARVEANTGGFVHEVAEQNNEIHFYLQSGNFTSGTFTLYRVV